MLAGLGGSVGVVSGGVGWCVYGGEKACGFGADLFFSFAPSFSL